MKKSIYLLLLLAVLKVNAQVSDSLYFTNGGKVACKIYEMSEYEIRYRVGGPDGVLFIMDKSKIRKYTLANGYSEVLIPDELSLENEHASIINNREVIKFQPYGLAFNHVTLAYEKVIKVGMNLDVEAGYINSNLNPSSGSLGMNLNNFHSGAYVKPGLKFFLGNDYSVRGMKYAHPLKGSYLKLDLAFSYMQFQDIKGYQYTYYNYSSQVTNTIITNINTTSYGGFINYGRQMILGNLFTFDVYGGVGFTGQSINYTNPDFKAMLNQQYNGSFYYNYGEGRMSNYYGWARVPGLGLSFTCGIRLGFIIPAKPARRTKITQ